jgi:hypothetical protein
VREYDFFKKHVDAFRCRMEYALRAVTRHATLEARLKGIKLELLVPEKLKVRRMVRQVAGPVAIAGSLRRQPKRPRILETRQASPSDTSTAAHETHSSVFDAEGRDLLSDRRRCGEDGLRGICALF